MTAAQAVGHLAGLQAQAPLALYVGLWTRLAGFGHQQLKDLLTERAVVRAHLMRNTVHLVDARDFVTFRPLYQPLMERGLAGNFGRNLRGVDLSELAAAAAALLAASPLTRAELGRRLAPRWPDHDPASLAYAATPLLHLVQVPPRGLWGETGQALPPLASGTPHLLCPFTAPLSPTSRRRPGSCPNTTICCSPSPNAAGSSRTAARSRCRRATGRPGARCSSTGSGRRLEDHLQCPGNPAAWSAERGGQGRHRSRGGAAPRLRGAGRGRAEYTIRPGSFG